MATTTTTTTTAEIELDEILPTSASHAHDESKGGRTLETITTLPSPTPNPASEETPQYPTGPRFHLICLAITLVLILGGIDNSIISTAIPAITADFNTISDIAWYSAAYRLATCSLQFTIGKFYKIFPLKPILLSCIAIFLIGSVLCATAPSSAVFIAGRAVTGIGAAGFLSGCFVLVTRILPLEKRPTWQSIFYGIELVFTNLAPTIGGVLVERVGWRWCFWIILPLGFVVLPVIAFVLPKETTTEERRWVGWREVLSQLDLVGNLVFIPSLTCLFIALSWAGTKYAWNSATVIGLLVTFAVLLGIFAYDQYVKGDKATLPPRVMKSRSVIAAMLFVFCSISAASVISYYMPIFFQSVHGYSPTTSGLLMLPKTVSFTIALLLTGKLTSLLGYYAPFMLIASILMPLGAGLITTWTPQTDLWRLILYPILTGIAGGIGSQGPSMAVQTVLPQADVSLGIAIVLFATNFGPAVAIPIAQVIFEAKLGGDVEAISLTNLDPEMVQTLSESLRNTWYWSVGLASALIIGAVIVEWRSVKRKTS